MDALQHQTGRLPVIRPDRTLGTVRWYSPEKGYGFIAPADGGEDVFVRHSAIDGAGFRTLEAGTTVTFLVTDDARGPRAVEVQRA